MQAFLDEDDPQHVAAVDAFASLHDQNADLVTHQYVVVECISLVQRRLGMTALRTLVEAVLPNVEVIWIDADLHADAVALMLSGGTKQVSLVDWSSFILMRRLGIATAFAFDADFAAQGFEVIPAAAA